MEALAEKTEIRQAFSEPITTEEIENEAFKLRGRIDMIVRGDAFDTDDAEEHLDDPIQQRRQLIAKYAAACVLRDEIERERTSLLDAINGSAIEQVGKQSRVSKVANFLKSGITFSHRDISGDRKKFSELTEQYRAVCELVSSLRKEMLQIDSTLSQEVADAEKATWKARSLECLTALVRFVEANEKYRAFFDSFRADGLNQPFYAVTNFGNFTFHSGTVIDLNSRASLKVAELLEGEAVTAAEAIQVGVPKKLVEDICFRKGLDWKGRKRK